MSEPFMKLAVEVTTCTPLRTGIGYYTEHVVDALLETAGPGDEVVLLSNQTPAPELAQRWSSHLRVSGPNVRAAWMQAAVPRLLADARADIALFPNYAVPLASPCPTIAVVHDLAVLRMPEHATLQKRLLMAPMLRQVAKTAAVVGTVSLASQRDIVSLLGVHEDRTVLLPGAAHPSCRPATANDVARVRARHDLARPYILTVGTLEPRKGLFTLLRAFDALRAAGETRELVVVGGRGWKDAALVRAIEERSGSGGVRWLGYVGEADLAALYTGADLFAFAPALEGFGLPLLEAMACGAPVLASDVAALREVGGDAPRFVPAGDEGAFALAMKTMLSEPKTLGDHRARGLARARDFSWKHTAETVWARARASAPTRVVSSPAPKPNGPAKSGKAVGELPAPLGSPPPALVPAEWALLAAVTYADLFSSPLPLHHAVAASMGVVLDVAKVRRLAEGRALSGRITLHPDGYLVLKGRESLVLEMPERERMTRALLERHKTTLDVLERLPFIRGLVVSGGVAHRNVTARADIDLFVIAAEGRAYTAYTWLFLATTLTGTRRVICPNYIVDESELAIAYHRDLFTAHQVVSARPMSGYAAYAAFAAANEAWVRALFPSFQAAPDTAPRPSSSAQAALELLLSPVAPWLESSLRAAWRFRLRRRAAAAPRADVVLADGLMKLHLSDYRARILDRFAGRLSTLRTLFSSDTSERDVASAS
jgi:glycosyltransferase involved in cell wall biosynthesis